MDGELTGSVACYQNGFRCSFSVKLIELLGKDILLPSVHVTLLALKLAIGFHPSRGHLRPCYEVTAVNLFPMAKAITSKAVAPSFVIAST
jgi:hypothetical protein